MLKEETLYNDIQKLRTKKDKYIKKITKQIFIIEDELDKICTHSKTTTKEQYHEGGYYNVAEYIKITECKFCGKELDRKTSYGGYA